MANNNVKRAFIPKTMLRTSLDSVLLILLATLYLANQCSSGLEQTDDDHWHNVVRTAQLNGLRVEEIEELPAGIFGNLRGRRRRMKTQRIGDMVESLLDLMHREL